MSEDDEDSLFNDESGNSEEDKSNDELDMFADANNDDDDDLFAEKPAQPIKQNDDLFEDAGF